MTGATTRASSKRKRDDEQAEIMNAKPFSPLTSSPRSLTQEIARVFETLTPLHNEAGSHSALDTAHQAIMKLYEICASSDAVFGWMLENSERVCVILTWLELKWYPADTDDALRMRDSCITCVCQLVGLLASQSDFRQPQHRKTQELILSKLVSILENAPSSEQAVSRTSSHLHTIFRNACEAMTSVLRDQKEAKRVIQDRGGIPLLVRLLHSVDSKVQRASTSVLRTLAFKEDEAKTAIVAAEAVPPLIRMLRSEDHATHYEAVGTLGNLVHSSPEIKKCVLDAGILQPVINLLQCSCRESLREAALLVGQFAQCDARGPQQVRRGARETEDYRVKIVQRGAVPPLIAMLKQQDRALREMAAFALGRLAQNADNQAGIFAMGVLQPLLDLLTSGVKNLEHNAAFTLYGLADNPDNVPEIVKRGGFERLRTADFIEDQPTKDCIDKTIRRIKERVQTTAFIKEHLKQLLMSRNTEMKHRMALCLAHLLDSDDLATAYSTYGGAHVLVDIVCDAHGVADKRQDEWRRALEALVPVVAVTQEREKDSLHHIEPCVPDEKVYLGKSYVNSPKQHDVVFVVDGKPFYAHKLALCASSEAFAAMFESGCKEGTGVPTINIPHIRRPVFEAMITFLYTGTMEECQDMQVMPDLLEAADQYLLTPLTKAVAERLAAKLDVDNVVDYYELAMHYNAKQLAYAASSFMVLHSSEIEAQLGEGAAGLARLFESVKESLNEYLQQYLWKEGTPRHSSDAGGDVVMAKVDVTML